MRSAARQAVVNGVKAHALAHYTDGGWDVIVECWSDDHRGGDTRLSHGQRCREDVRGCRVRLG
jgi:hypothetical protein